ncbi:MAG: hypothetical protein ACRCYY_16405 [Trueperaceae bacterium]
MIHKHSSSSRCTSTFLFIALVGLLVACSSPSLTEESEESVDASALDDGGYTVFLNSKFANQPEQTGYIFSYFIEQTEEDLFPLMGMDPETLQPKIEALVDRLDNFLPEQTCTVRTPDDFVVDSTIVYKDVGPNVTLTSSQNTIVLEPDVNDPTTYVGVAPDVVASDYRVAVAGREGLNTRSYNGSLLKTGKIPTITAPAGMTGAEPVQLSKSGSTEIRWTPTGSTTAYIQIDNPEEIFIYCYVADTGSFTIPADVTARFPDAGTIYVGSLNVRYATLENRRVTHLGFGLQTNSFVAQ